MIEPSESLLPLHIQWDQLLDEPGSRGILEQEALPQFLRNSRWFGGKAHKFEVSIHTFVRIPHHASFSYQLLLSVAYEAEESELYNLSISMIPGNTIDLAAYENAIIYKMQANAATAYVVDAFYDPGFRDHLFLFLKEKRHIQTDNQLLQFQSVKSVSETSDGSAPPSRLLRTEQSNTSIIYGGDFILKMFRRVAFATNPDLEVTRYLTKQTDFRNIPAYRGVIQLIVEGRQSTVLGLMQDLIVNEGDAWELFKKDVQVYYHAILTGHPPLKTPPAPLDITEYSAEELQQLMTQLVGKEVSDKVEMLAMRTAELHMALVSHPSDPDFAPEPVEEKYRKGLYKSLKKQAASRLGMLATQLDSLPDEVAVDARMIIDQKDKILKFFKKRLKKNFKAAKIRIHGDYHLGQVLYTGNDFFILDFEGEPEKPFEERRRKHIALKDVAGMIRSFHYVTYTVLMEQMSGQVARSQLESWADLWYQAVSRFFLEQYIETSRGQVFLPKRKNLVSMLQLFLLEKSIYELGYEMNNRPTWVKIPIRGIKHFINQFIQKQKISKS